MSNDDNKTVFQPRQSPNPDRTIILPTPGRRSGAGHPNQQAPAAAQPYVGDSNIYKQDSFKTHSGLNPLVNSAALLIAVFEKTRNTLSHPDIGGLYQSLNKEIRDFQARLQKLEIKPEIAISARYLLCSALDEAVLNTPWGAESQWPQKTLLSVFHNETSGGEKFFQILVHLRKTPSENRDILELMYILISLGFEGRYRFADRGKDALEAIRDDLFISIRGSRGEYERGLSPNWQGVGKIKNSLAEYLPMWVVASIIGLLLVVCYSGFRYWLYDTSTPVIEELQQIVKLDKAL